MKKLFCMVALVVFGLVGCKPKEISEHEIRVGTIAGPETALMEVAKQVALERYGLHVKIIAFSDYSMPNAALEDGSIDANMFQHAPFLQKENKERGYHIVEVGKTFVYPMGVYSTRISSLRQLKSGDRVAIPNDPSNEMRALILLQKAKIIQLNPHATVTGTISDIQNNPLHLRFIALDAAQLPRSLQDVTIAVINTNYAIPAGFHPSNALFTEGTDSPYANIIATRENKTRLTQVQDLIETLHSSTVLAEAKRIFGDSAIPAWTVRSNKEYER